MLCAYTRPRSQVNVFQDHWSSGLYVHDFGPRARNNLDLQYSHSFINSIRCLLLPTFRSLASIFQKNPLFSLFPMEKAKLQNLTLP